MELLPRRSNAGATGLPPAEAIPAGSSGEMEAPPASGTPIERWRHGSHSNHNRPHGVRLAYHPTIATSTTGTHHSVGPARTEGTPARHDATGVPLLWRG